MSSCNRCKGTTSDPHNFLLCCSECGKSWHHRCHIPPLSDLELVALLRATNDNDVDNGLSSWVGRCCRKRRVQAQATPEASIHPDLPVSVVSRQGKSSLSVPNHSTHHLDQTLLSSGTATSPNQDDELAIVDLSFHKPAARMGSQKISVEPELQYPQARPGSALSPPDVVETPLPSTSSSSTFAPSSVSNQPSTSVLYSHPSHLREGPMAVERIPTSQPGEPTNAPGPSQLREPSPVIGRSRASTKPRPMDIDPPTLDLRALSLNRAPGPSKAPLRLLFQRVTTSRDPSPPPPPTVPSVKLEDDGMEDLYAPPIGHPSPSAQHPPQRGRPHVPSPSPSLQYPEEPRPLVLPALAAKDPRILAALERHERREAARPRQGTRKVQAVRGAGKRRGRVTLVANRTEREMAQAAEASQQAITRSHQCIMSFLERVER